GKTSSFGGTRPDEPYCTQKVASSIRRSTRLDGGGGRSALMMSIVLVSVVLAAYALAGISAGTGSVLLFVCRQGESSNPGPTLPRSFGGLPGTGRRALIGSAGIPRSKCRSRISIHES